MIFLLLWPLEKASLEQKMSTLNKSAPMQVLSRQAGHTGFVLSRQV